MAPRRRETVQQVPCTLPLELRAEVEQLAADDLRPRRTMLAILVREALDAYAATPLDERVVAVPPRLGPKPPNRRRPRLGIPVTIDDRARLRAYASVQQRTLDESLAMLVRDGLEARKRAAARKSA